MYVAASHCFQGDFRSPAAQGTVRTPTRLSNMRIIGTRLSLLVAGVALVAGPAFAQAPKPTAPPDATHDAKPTAPAENLSKKLNQSNGVIHPKEVDPAIEKPGRQIVHDPNVVPPPGTSGGAPAPQPK